MFCHVVGSLEGLGSVQGRQFARTSLSELMTCPGADGLKIVLSSMQEDVPILFRSTVQSLVLLLSLCGSSWIGTSRGMRQVTLVTALLAVLALNETGLQTHN